MTRTFVVVPSAGGGTRAGSDLPKQYRALLGRPMLARTLDRLQSAITADAIVVVLAPGDVRYEPVIGARSGVEPVRCGGATRALTVANALAHLAGRAAADDWVLVHDAARPCVPGDALRRLVGSLADDPVGGLLAIPVADTIKRADDEAQRVARTEDRRSLWQAQTPQMFRYGLLDDALRLSGAGGFTDEAQAIEALAERGRCARPRLVAGSRANLKITYPDDWALAEAILAAQEGQRT